MKAPAIVATVALVGGGGFLAWYLLKGDSPADRARERARTRTSALPMFPVIEIPDPPCIEVDDQGVSREITRRRGESCAGAVQRRSIQGALAARQMAARTWLNRRFGRVAGREAPRAVRDMILTENWRDWWNRKPALRTNIRRTMSRAFRTLPTGGGLPDPMNPAADFEADRWLDYYFSSREIDRWKRGTRPEA